LKEQGRLEVLNKRTAADLVRPLLSESEADDETTKKDKVVKIVS
jgi:hypothetical protein